MNHMSEKKVMIVDDDSHVTRFLTFLLQKNGYEVEIAKDGPEALEKARKLKPRLVLLDLKLPGMSGLEVCRLIKSDPELKDTYVITVTAYGTDLNRWNSHFAGANEYMTKPFNLAGLVEHLEELFYSFEGGVS